MERRQRTARELNLGKYLQPGYNLGPWWAPAEVRLLGKRPDDEVAAKVGRTHNAVRIKREKLGIPNPVVDRRWPAERASGAARPLPGHACRRAARPATALAFPT